MKITVPDIPPEPSGQAAPAKYLSYSKVLAEYGIPQTVLRPLIRSGRLEAIKPNPNRRGAVFILRESLEQLIKTRRYGRKTDPS